MPTVAVKQYLYRDEAEIGRAALNSAGIAAVVRAEDEGGLSPGFYSEFRVALLVNDSDLATAREVLGIAAPLILPRQVREAMLAHARWAYPNEACGLIAGEADRVGLVLCLTNRLDSPVRYSIDPREHYGAAKFAEACGLTIMGAWHSHPNGDASISATDIAESPGGSWITLIVGNYAKARDSVRAYRTDSEGVLELEIVGERGA